MRTDIVDHVIDTAAVLAEVANAGNGASVLFVGTVREVNDGRDVSGMEYSAYLEMARRELHAVAAEAASRFGTNDIVVVHRIGSLDIGEASVAIAAAHPHRAAAFESARYIIEELKQRVPIWKREHYLDGTREWVNAQSSSIRAEETSSGGNWR